MEHDCIQKEQIDKIIKKIDGNGQPGLFERVLRIEGKIDTLIGNVEDLTTVISGLTKFQAEITGIEKEKEKVFNKTWIVVGAMISIAAIVVTIIIKV
jgi:hypothetical protein